VTRPTLSGIARKLAATGVAVITAGGCVAISTSGAAHATARSCTVKSGKTSNLALGSNGPHPTGGTIFVKSSSSTCHDLNIDRVSATDSYEGWLFNSHTSKWSHCQKKFVHITKGKHPDIVLCSGVLANTKMAVVQKSNTRRTITAKY
jgi:hypothetical protein